MEIQDIKTLKNDINRLRRIESVVTKYKDDPQCDKLEFGFNVDSRFKGSGVVEVWLGGYKGYFGSSSVTSIFEIGCQKEFRKAFIEVLNDMRSEIISKVADKMQEELKSRSDEILKEINELTKLYNQAIAE